MPGFGVTPVSTFPPPVADQFPSSWALQWRPVGADTTIVKADARNGIACGQTGGTLKVIINADIGDTTIDFDPGDAVLVYNEGTAKVTVTPATGVNLLFRSTLGASLAGQYSVGTLVKRTANTWVWYGDISA